MAETITHYKVFIASPRGLENEREQILEVFDSFNKYRTGGSKINFDSVDYKVAPGGVGRPQSEINKFIRESDFFILLLHDKWGTSPDSSSEPSKYTSATEEEFYLALECYNNNESPMRQVLPIFKALELNRLEDPGDELKKILTFKANLEDNKVCFYETFDSEKKFKSVLEKNLSAWLNNIRSIPNKKNTLKETSPIALKKPPLEIQNIEINNQFSKNKNESISQINELITDGQFLRAELMYSRLYTMYPNNSTISIAYAQFYIKRGLPKNAIEILNKISNNHSLSNIDNAIICREKGNAEEIRGNNKEAEIQYRESIKLLNDCLEKEEKAKSLIKLGGILKKNGTTQEQALDILNDALKLYVELKDKKGQTKAYEYMGLIYKTMGKIEDAEKSYSNALKNIDVIDDEIKANIFSNLGVILRIKGLCNDAILKHNEAYDLFKKIADTKGQSRELGNLGVAYRQLKKYDIAEEKHQASLKIARDFGHTSNIVMQLDNLGMVAFEQIPPKFDEALEYYFQALGINQSVNNKIGVSFQMRHIGEVYIAQEEYTKARDILLDAIELNKNNEFETALTKAILAKALFGIGDKGESLRHAINSLRVLEQSAPNYDITKSMKELVANLESQI